MRIRQSLYRVMYFLAAVAGGGPLFLYVWNPQSPWLTPSTIAALNLIAWSLVFIGLITGDQTLNRLLGRAQKLGIDTRLKGFEELFKEVMFELRRKNESLSINLVHGKISSQEELTSALEKVVSRAYDLLSATSAELALFDKDSGLYHSAFLLGRPFRRSAQAMLSDALSEAESSLAPEVMIQPVIFAGEMLGTLRIALKQGRVPSSADREIIELLALQAGLALLNARYSQQLLKMHKSSEETTRARTGFLANLSHEIRGPLGIMLNAVELILEGICGTVSEEQTKTLGMIQTNGKHLLELINDVLDYSKVESGKLHPKKVDILLDPTLKEITTIIRSQAVEKGHKLNYIKTDEPLAINCDKRHFRQMLINLLTNAVKYTPEGGVIDVWAERTAKNRLRINVKDSGIGISEADREKVFAPFERIENEYAMTQVGTGLGMPLTRRLAEVNGGKIDFSSTSGKGSQFWLDFAVAEPPAFVDEKRDEKIKVDGRGDLVLVLEKDKGERDMIAKYLSKHGFSVAPAATKIDAQEMLAEKKVSIVVVDNNVTDDPKDNVIDFIRQHSTQSTMPVVLISSRAFVSDIRKYLKEGVDRCLIKPVPLAELALICRSMIDGHSHQPTSSDIETQDPKASNDFSQLKPPNPTEISH